MLIDSSVASSASIYTPFNDDDDAYRPELPNHWERYAPTPGYPDRE